ncbi:MAG: ribonuclease H-like domain-containing protein [candidate division KSB1 bacterium]|nr:ribonuclease H-like domain-containing protein [candidate division KSB1 bacterium]
MDVFEKLRWIDSLSLPTVRPERQTSGHDIEQYLGGELYRTPVGTCFLTTMRVPLPCASVLSASCGLLHLVGKDESLRSLDLRRVAFLDCETTGLAGGSGTYCFLVGIGALDQGEAVVKQFFMRNLHEEPALLHAVHQELKGYEGIVTYNGKAYDYPLLLTRFALRRMPAPERLPHLDLLHAARRVWRDRLQTLTLNAVETELLGVTRERDVPGELIPGIYFSYLRTRDAAQMPLVFEHNRQDITSLMQLAAMLLSLHADPATFAGHAGDLVALGRVYEDLRLFERSAALYEMAHAKGLDARTTEPALVRLSLCYKRLGQWDKALPLWEQMAAKGKGGIFPFVELAKYYEHRARQYHRAIELVDRALHTLEVQELGGETWQAGELRAELLHRRRRLLSKLGGIFHSPNDSLKDPLP